jgi:hypothetical protein
MEEAPEKGKLSLHSSHANGMTESIFVYVEEIIFTLN